MSTGTPNQSMLLLRSCSGILVVILLCFGIVKGKWEITGVWSIHLFFMVLLSFSYAACMALVTRLNLDRDLLDNIHPAARKILFIQGGIVLLLFVYSPEIGAVLSGMSMARVREYYSLKTSLLVLLACYIALLLSMLRHYMDTLGFGGVIFWSFLASSYYIFTLAITNNASKEKELRREALDLNRELLATQELLAQSTRQSERLRIARDMHDLLGHQMTALILNLEVASHLAQGEVLDKVEQSLALAKLLLSDLRNAVSDLRENASLDFRQALDRILDNIPELDVELSIEDTLEIPDIRTAETLIRCIQESLTNVLRHADASRCRINLCMENNEIVMLVTDNGSLKKSIEPGNGLNGMLERIQALSGKLEWGEMRGSFFLRAVLPVKAL